MLLLRTRAGQSPAPPVQVNTAHAGSVPRDRRHRAVPCPAAGSSGVRRGARRAAPGGHTRPRSAHRAAPRSPGLPSAAEPPLGPRRGTDVRVNELELAGPGRLRGGEGAGGRRWPQQLRRARAGKRSAPARARRNTLTGGEVCSRKLRRSRLQSVSHSLRSWGCGKDQRQGLQLTEPVRW